MPTAGDLTFATLKLRARDQLGDKADTKADRRAGRIVNQALKYLSSEKRWTWYRRLWTILLKPKITYTDAVTMEAESRTVTLESGSWASNASDLSFGFSGDTTILRIRSRDSSTALTTFSNEVYVASTAMSAATGFLYYDRFALPANFRAIHGVPQERDYYQDLCYLPPREFLDLRQSYQSTQSSPVYFTIGLNEASRFYELWFWPTPSDLREASFWIYVSPMELESDGEVADWDPSLSYALHAAIDLFVVRELMQAKLYPTYERFYRAAVLRAKQEDQRYMPDDRATRDLFRRNNKIQRSPAGIVDTA